MAYKQLKSPNLNQKGVSGLCLKFVREAFGIPARYATAWSAWANVNKRHTDALPSDVCVPVFFSWSGDLGDGNGRQNYGDVAIWVPGRGVFGTPIKGGKDNRWDASPQARAKAIGGNCTYQGWAEDVNEVAVAQYYVAPAPAKKTIYFPPDTDRWRYYVPNAPLTLPKNAWGSINPKKFGGLTYTLQGFDNKGRALIDLIQLNRRVAIPVANATIKG